jgi:hypothetical protein
MLLLSVAAAAQEPLKTRNLNEWLTVSGNFDASYRETQFFKDGHDTSFFQWDTRLELWGPPYRNHFSWGPYLRLAGKISNRDEAFENGWLAEPGFGLQAYPFSFDHFRTPSNVLGKALGPLRAFVEYNIQDYWGDENRWRPDEQVRAGFDYYKALHVNSSTKPWWVEMYGQLTWESANEFDDDYNSLIFANAIRAGARIPDAGLLSAFTPYVLAESTLTENRSYAFENRLLLGGGIRFAPDMRLWPGRLDWISRFVIFAEYLNAAAYYKAQPPSGTPNHDFRVGIAVSVGDFYK